MDFSVETKSLMPYLFMGGSIMGYIWIRLSFPLFSEGTVESDYGSVCSLPSFAVGVGVRGGAGSAPGELLRTG